MKVKCQNPKCKAVFSYELAIKNTSYECPYPKCNKPCNIRGRKKRWYTSEEVWDDEWIKLLDKPAKVIPKLRKLFLKLSIFVKKKEKDRQLIESIRRGIMDLKKGKYVSVKDLDRFFKEL